MRWTAREEKLLGAQPDAEVAPPPFCNAAFENIFRFSAGAVGPAFTKAELEESERRPYGDPRGGLRRARHWNGGSSLGGS